MVRAGWLPARGEVVWGVWRHARGSRLRFIGGGGRSLESSDALASGGCGGVGRRRRTSGACTWFYVVVQRMKSALSKAHGIDDNQNPRCVPPTRRARAARRRLRRA
eukprot:6103181-Prymnesium_polylepis.1